MARQYRWVSCAADVAPTVAEHRHLLPVEGGSQGVTVCNASGFGEGVWRGNTRKPKCPTCTSTAARTGLTIVNGEN